jgi:hypothetical protein
MRAWEQLWRLLAVDPPRRLTATKGLLDQGKFSANYLRKP